MSDPLESSHRKFARGKEHVQNLERELHAFYGSDPYEGVIEPDPETTGNVVLKVKLTKPFPEALPVIIGDAAANLRAALDHAVYGVAIASGRLHPREAYFPFSGNYGTFESNMKGRCKDVPREIWPLFRKLKPYKGGNSTLWALNEMCVWDKHKTLTPVGGASVRHKAMVSSNSIGQFWKMPVTHKWDRTKNEMVLLTARGDAKIYHDFSFTFFVAFDEIPSVEGRPLDGVLNEMVGEVESVLWAIETETRRLFPAAFL